MRPFGLILGLLVAAGATASAEKVKTNQDTKVLNHPGEQGRVVLKVKSGQNMTVIAKEGRWLKVRVSGRTGYVPRSKVDMADGDEIVRNTRRRPFVDGRGTKRGFGTAEGPDDRVGADATGDSGGDDDKAKPAKGEDDDNDKENDKPAKGHKPIKKPAKGEEAVDDDDDKTDDNAEDAPAEKRLTAHVSAKTKIYSERDKHSEVAFTAKPDDLLYPTDSKGKWTMVETEEGDPGWVLTSSLDVDDPDGGGGPRKREIGLTARAGVSFIQQGMRATGSTMTTTTGFNPDNYNIGTSAATISLGGRITVPYDKNYVLGVEGTLDYASTVFGGIHVAVGTVTADTGISVADFNLRGLAGYDFHKPSGMVLFGRLGFRYRNYAVDGYNDPTKNPALIPQEVLKAPTLGVGLAVPRLSDNLGLQLSLDTILVGASVTQTAGLEDGSTPSMYGATLGGRIIYRWKQDMDLEGTYDLDYASYDFGAPLAQSKRGHMGTDTTRTDILHTVTFGIIKSI